MGIVRNF